MAQIYEMVQKALRGPKDERLSTFAIDLYWPYIVVVPLINGKSLNGTAWRSMSTVLRDFETVDDLGIWNFIDNPIPKSAWQILELEKWQHPQINCTHQLFEAIAEFRILCYHLQDLIPLIERPEMDEMSQLQLDEYSILVNNHLDMLFKRIPQSMEEFLGFYVRISEELPETELAERPSLLYAIELFQLVVEDVQSLLDTGAELDTSESESSRFSLNLDEMHSTIEILDRVTINAQQLHLNWATDRLGQNGIGFSLPMSNT